MPTNLAIDDVLLEDALQLGGFKTKRETVDEALREFVARRKRRDAVSEFGTIDFEEAFDHKAARRKR